MTALNIALVGSPNCGKTALFNRLTGARQKVANYAGVTVEKKEGRFTLPDGRIARMLDLPGTYSFAATSPDEAVTRDLCLGRMAGEARPDVIVAVVDATNLRLHLRFVLEVMQLKVPMVLALNCADLAAARGITIDVPQLAKLLGIPVVRTVAIQQGGAQPLLAQLVGQVPVPQQAPKGDLHAQVNALLAATVHMPRATSPLDDRLDAILLHPVLGLALLSLLLFIVFQGVFTWAAPLQDGLEAVVAALGNAVEHWLPPGPLNSLLVNGVIAGMGSVLVFLPQILILFFFILVLEESGYLPRAAFLLDRIMVSAGLSGRSFIPLLSSFACAVPGIMATRSIQDPRDRLATILVAPLMTCSARLPVYTLLIAAFVPEQQVAGVLSLRGLVLFALYVLGIASALLVALVFKRLRGKGGEHSLMLELPNYRFPNPRDITQGLWQRGAMFLQRVGTIILTLTVVLWALASFPLPPEGFSGAAIDYSLAGRLGHALSYVFAPLGFNWQICIALIPGLAAREVAVASLATVYALSATGDAAASALAPIIATTWTLPTALSLIAWYVYAPQCISTLVVIRRETNSWRQVWVAAGYLFGLAYLASFITYQVAVRCL